MITKEKYGRIGNFSFVIMLGIALFVDVVTICDRSLNRESGHHVYKANASGRCD
jgi:hypothetical protein